MPELPEVETTARGIRPHIEGQYVINSTVRNRGLRWPVTDGLEDAIQGKSLRAITRRGKYLILDFGDNHTVLWHLGMSGSLRIAQKNEALLKHDHIDITFSNGVILRYCDPRRFGAVLLTYHEVNEHKLIHHHFAQELHVYGRKGLPCVACAKPLTEKRLTGRSTVYCTVCQK